MAKAKAKPQEANNPPAEDHTETADKKKSHKGLDFSDLLKSDKKKSTTPPVAENKETPEPEPEPKETRPTSKDLTFINFDTASTQQPAEGMVDKGIEDTSYSGADTDVTSAKELRRQEKALRRQEKRKEKAGKKSLFETMLEKDTVAPTGKQQPSIAKPLFGVASGASDKSDDASQDMRSDQQMTESGSSACSQVADESYYKKVRRKIASKKSDASMLHTAKKYFDGVCYSTAQIKKLAYLFASDESRFQFLKVAYLHVSDRKHFKTLVETLSSSNYQKRLKAFIR